MELSGPRRLNEVDLNQTVQLVNDTYQVAESLFWKNSWVRTNCKEMKKFIDEGQLLGIFDNEQIVGCIRYFKVSQDTCEFGMLSSHQNYRNLKIGTQLVSEAENQARKQGLKKMQLFLLQGKEIKSEEKDLISRWYTRLGYVRVQDFELNEIDPELSNKLLIPAVFCYFLKAL